MPSYCSVAFNLVSISNCSCQFIPATKGGVLHIQGPHSSRRPRHHGQGARSDQIHDLVQEEKFEVLQVGERWCCSEERLGGGDHLFAVGTGDAEERWEITPTLFTIVFFFNSKLLKSKYNKKYNEKKVAVNNIYNATAFQAGPWVTPMLKTLV